MISAYICEYRRNSDQYLPYFSSGLHTGVYDSTNKTSDEPFLKI